MENGEGPNRRGGGSSLRSQGSRRLTETPIREPDESPERRTHEQGPPREKAHPQGEYLGHQPPAGHTSPLWRAWAAFHLPRRVALFQEVRMTRYQDFEATAYGHTLPGLDFPSLEAQSVQDHRRQNAIMREKGVRENHVLYRIHTVLVDILEELRNTSRGHGFKQVMEEQHLEELRGRPD